MLVGILDLRRALCYTLPMDDSRWHILKVKPGCEDAVAASCGAPAYVPRHRVEKFNRKLRKVVRYVTALIPGFVFVLLRAPSDLARLPEKRVHGFLRNGDKTPATLTKRAFDLLKRVEADARAEIRETVAQIKKRPLPKVGEKVAVNMALFGKAVDALVEEIKDNKLLVRVIRSNLRVTTTLDKLADQRADRALVA